MLAKRFAYVCAGPALMGLLAGGCSSSIRLPDLNVDLKPCEIRAATPPGPLDEMRLKGECCDDHNWTDLGIDPADSAAAERFDVAKSRSVRVLSLRKEDPIVLRIISAEDSLLFEATQTTDGNGLAVFPVSVWTRPWMRDGFYYLVVFSSGGCFKSWVHVVPTTP